MQIQRGKVAVTNGSAVVKHVWHTFVASLVGGPYVVGETVGWRNSGNPADPADGVGVVVRWEPLSKELLFTRSSGAAPVVGAYVLGVTSTAHSLVSSMDVDSPPGFDGLGIGGQTFVPGGTGSRYVVAGAGITSDGFSLTAPYGEATSAELSYAIHVDFTANRGYDRPNLDDLDLPATVSRALDKIDADVQALQVPAVGWATPSLGAAFAASGGVYVAPRYLKDGGGWVHLSGAADSTDAAAPDTVWTLPAGFRPGYTLRFPQRHASQPATIEVTSGGVVRFLEGGSLTLISFDGIIFQAEAV